MAPRLICILRVSGAEIPAIRKCGSKDRSSVNRTRLARSKRNDRIRDRSPIEQSGRTEAVQERRFSRDRLVVEAARSDFWIGANFFARLHRLSCRSRLSASSIGCGPSRRNSTEIAQNFSQLSSRFAENWLGPTSPGYRRVVRPAKIPLIQPSRLSESDIHTRPWFHAFYRTRLHIRPGHKNREPCRHLGRASHLRA